MGRRGRHHVARRNPHASETAAVALYGEPDLLRIVESTRDPLVLILDGVQDPHNLGACLRTADAAGCCALVAPERRAASITETVRRIACGGAENVPFVEVVNLTRTIERLQERNLRAIATADKADELIYEANLTGPLALVVGAEGKGVRRNTARACDALVHIPMADGAKADCLNVSVATGVCLFEIVRQRLKG